MNHELFLIMARVVALVLCIAAIKKCLDANRKFTSGHLKNLIHWISMTVFIISIVFLLRFAVFLNFYLKFSTAAIDTVEILIAILNLAIMASIIKTVHIIVKMSNLYGFKK